MCTLDALGTCSPMLFCMLVYMYIHVQLFDQDTRQQCRWRKFTCLQPQYAHVEGNISTWGYVARPVLTDTQIGALRDLRKDMGVRRNVLLQAVVAELERRVYYTAIGEASDSSSDEDETPELSATLVMDEVRDQRYHVALGAG